MGSNLAQLLEQCREELFRTRDASHRKVPTGLFCYNKKMLVLVGIVQIIQSLVNLWWKFLLSSKNPPNSSWLFTVCDTVLFTIVGLYLGLYSLVAFELFFMFVALGLFSRTLHKLHYAVVGIIVSVVYLLNTINPVTTLELVAVGFFILAVYFWANKKMRWGWIAIIPGHLFLLIVLISKGAWIVVVAQVISLLLAIRGIKNTITESKK